MFCDKGRCRCAVSIFSFRPRRTDADLANRALVTHCPVSRLPSAWGGYVDGFCVFSPSRCSVALAMKCTIGRWGWPGRAANPSSCLPQREAFICTR